MTDRIMVKLNRRAFALGALVSAAVSAIAQTASLDASGVLHAWYGLVLKLVRHTPTYSPPVASRAFAYLGVTAYESIASGAPDLASLAGQLNGLSNVPARKQGEVYNESAVTHAALSEAVTFWFNNTGPTGQRVLERFKQKLGAATAAEVEASVMARSIAHGQAVARHIRAWSETDGGATVENLGFPIQYDLKKGKANWVPTGPQNLQQKPLLPQWGANRTFAMPTGNACSLLPPPAYSEDPASAFHSEAMEVYGAVKSLTDEQRAIARFWSDDPMLSPTPPGHWISIALQILEKQNSSVETCVDVLARLGITLADAFIGCWQTKFEYDLLRPVTYIRRHIDPKWEPLLITPPFPEYPSGHSAQSGAAAVVLAKLFGDATIFEDRTHARDGLKARRFESFSAAAQEAAMSRLYGGIHFRSGVERGLDQGRCIGQFTNALTTRK
jgi:hypothetical protein